MSWFQPDLYYSSIYAVDLDLLRERGVDAIIIDLDNTILPRDTGLLDQRARDWVANAKERFRLAIVSNNTKAYPYEIAAELELPIITAALKPTTRGFRAAMRMLEVTPRETAVIGDQLFTDVIGGNRAGATSVLVDPLVEHDLPHTLLLRRLTAPIIRHEKPLR